MIVAEVLASFGNSSLLKHSKCEKLIFFFNSSYLRRKKIKIFDQEVGLCSFLEEFRCAKNCIIEELYFYLPKDKNISTIGSILQIFVGLPVLNNMVPNILVLFMQTTYSIKLE